MFDEKEDDGLIMLVNEQGTSRPVSGLELGVILHDHHSLRLAVLNACEGARGSIDNPLGGVAQTLIRQGLPAAVAMQFEISEEAALVFAHEFYMAIADGYPIDAATVEARKAIFASGNDVEWGTPVLHLRSSDARVFDLQRTTQPPVSDDLRKRAMTALEERRFADAVALWEQVVESSPNDETAGRFLAQAGAGLDAERLYAQAGAAVQNGDPDSALTLLERVDELDPLLGDPGNVGDRARELKEVAADGEVDRARASMDDGELHEARRILDQVLVAVPDHAGALDAREQVERRIRARDLMDQAKRAFEVGDWEQVVALVEDAEELDPQLHDDEGLKREASMRLALASTAAGTEAPEPGIPPLPPSVEPPAPAPIRGTPAVLRWAMGVAAALVVFVGVVQMLPDGEPSPGPDDTGGDPTTTVAVEPTTTPGIVIPEGAVAVSRVDGVRVDGDSSDWPDLDEVESDRPVFPRTEADPVVTASWLIGWDEDALYLLARASDASVDPGPLDDPSQMYQGDSVHFEIGPDSEGAESLRSGDKHVILAPGDRSGAVVVAINVPQGGVFVPGLSGEDTGVQAVASAIDRGYVIEAAIPWEALGMDPAPGLVFGLNVNISDGKPSGGLNQMVSSNANRTAGGQNTPAVWNRAVLR